MTLYEMRLITVLGFVGLGIFAILAALSMTALKDLARRVDERIARSRALPPLRGDSRDAARLIDRRQAAGRLRC